MYVNKKYINIKILKTCQKSIAIAAAAFNAQLKGWFKLL